MLQINQFSSFLRVHLFLSYFRGSFGPKLRMLRHLRVLLVLDFTQNNIGTFYSKYVLIHLWKMWGENSSKSIFYYESRILKKIFSIIFELFSYFWSLLTWIEAVFDLFWSFRSLFYFYLIPLMKLFDQLKTQMIGRKHRKVHPFSGGEKLSKFWSKMTQKCEKNEEKIET